MKDDFRRVKRRILLQVLLIAGAALLIGVVLRYLLVDGILETPFIEAFVSACEALFGVGGDTALRAYDLIFRNNKSLWMSIGLVFLAFVSLYFGMTRFIRYFREIGEGIRQLADESPDAIVLSPELAALEDKLNQVRGALVRRADEAREAEQRKNDLVVYLAHDIKTPLTSIIGYLSLLDEAPDIPEHQRAKYTDITLKKAYRLERLVDEFFEITRFNLQSIVIEREPIVLSMMLMQIADEFYPQLSPEGKQARVWVEEGTSIEGDAGKLARVFNNIMKNAIAYSDPGTVIEIGAMRRESAVEIIFKNQGRTIPADKLDTIFEKFFRLDTSRSTQTGGAGLGLAISKEIVTAHGGTIGARSHDGITVFSVLLPAPCG